MLFVGRSALLALAPSSALLARQKLNDGKNLHHPVPQMQFINGTQINAPLLSVQSTQFHSPLFSGIVPDISV